MNRISFRLAVPLVAVVALLLTGCPGEVIKQATNAAKRDALMDHLKALGMAYHNFHDSNGRGPQSWDELQQAGLAAASRQAIEAEGYVVVVGLAMRDVTIGTSNFLIAYPANPSGEWILVGKMDGSVQQMQSGEFQDALAAQQPLMDKAVVLQPSAAAPSPPSAPSGGSSPPPPPPGNP
jgi:hypothetical protein